MEHNSFDSYHIMYKRCKRLQENKTGCGKIRQLEITHALQWFPEKRSVSRQNTCRKIRHFEIFNAFLHQNQGPIKILLR